MRWVLLTALAVVCVAQCPPDARAQAREEPLKLAGAMQRALAQHPALSGFVFELRAQDARAAEAALRPDIQADVLVEDAGGTGDRSGFSGAQTTLSLSQLIELGGKRDARIAVAQASHTHLQTVQAAQQLDVAAEVTRRFIETLHEQARLTIAEQALQFAQGTLTAVEQRVRAARAPQVEEARAQVLLAQARLDLEHSEHELQSSRRFLAAAMGERDVRFGRSEGQLLPLIPTLAFEGLVKRIDASPDFLRFADEARVRDAELRLAELKRRPDIRATLGVRRYEEGDDVALVAGFSVPLFSARRAQAAIDAARVGREHIDVIREAAFLKVQAQLFAQYQELEHARLEARTLQEDIIPRLETALGQTRYAYERGRYSYLEWTEVQRELLEAKRRLIDVATDFHTLRVEIERLTGQSLDVAGAMP